MQNSRDYDCILDSNLYVYRMISLENTCSLKQPKADEAKLMDLSISFGRSQENWIFDRK